MDLNELKASVLEQAQKTKELANTERDLKDKIKSVIKKNYKEIAEPFLIEMNNLVNSIHELSDTYPSDLVDGELVLDAESKEKQCSLKLHEYWGGMYPVLKQKGNHSYDDLSIDLTRTWNGGDWILYLKHWFTTEEKTQEFVDACKKSYVHILNKYADVVENKNKKLADSIAKLTEVLSKSSSVEPNEDGTVEIHLGGKTYTATLKESE